MYIRRTAIKSRKDGTNYYSYRLVESKRTEKGVRQHTLLNLGAYFSLPREQWPELTKRIEGILSGQQSLFDIDHEIEELAQSYASRIIASYQDSERLDSRDYREVDLDSLEMSRPRSVGAEHPTLEALRLLGLDVKFKELGFNGPQTAAAIGTIVSRCCEPASELATHAWLQEKSGLGELIDYDFNNLSLYGLYQVSDQLLKKKAAIEEHLYKREHNLFGLQETITLYDLTNTYFEGQSKANAFGAHGHSKEKRSDCPLVTLGLVLDSSGFPRRSHVYEGNVSEPTTLAEMLHDLEGGTDSTGLKPTVVMDAGIATDDNITWLREHHYPYLVVSRKRHREFDEEKDDITGYATKMTWQQKVVENTTDSYPGVYCLRTSHADWDEALLWNTYTMLTDLEAVFRSLKSELGLRPIHHQITDRVAGHLFITVLAYHLVHTIRFRLKQQKIHSRLVKYSEHPVKPQSGDSIHAVQKWQHCSY